MLLETCIKSQKWKDRTRRPLSFLGQVSSRGQWSCRCEVHVSQIASSWGFMHGAVSSTATTTDAAVMSCLTVDTVWVSPAELYDCRPAATHSTTVFNDGRIVTFDLMSAARVSFQAELHPLKPIQNSFLCLSSTVNLKPRPPSEFKNDEGSLDPWSAAAHWTVCSS